MPTPQERPAAVAQRMRDLVRDARRLGVELAPAAAREVAAGGRSVAAEIARLRALARRARASARRHG